MLRTIVKKGSYQDSVVLMLLTNKIAAMEGIDKVSIMMGTPSNKVLFKTSGLETKDLLDASANDMVIVVDSIEDMMEQVLEETERFLKNQAAKNQETEKNDAVKTWAKAKEKLPEANLCVISIPGAYAALEADRALDENLNVFMFSDNVSKEDELALKKKAHKKGLLVMGPDCGTGIIQGVPIAFTNHVSKGNIGIVGASGTGIQELTTIIDRLGAGVTNAIGTGGRDLASEIGGITMLDAINAMEQDDDTKVVIVISKPPAKDVRDKMVKRLEGFTKPVITLFLGEKPEVHEEGFYHAYTLDEAARIAVDLSRKGESKGELVLSVDEIPKEFSCETSFRKEEMKTIRGYYSGGTLAAEAAMMIRDTLSIPNTSGKSEGYMLHTDGHVIIDLGDDIYTQGKPHPMIDPTKRAECMKEAATDESTGVILFDVVLGYGSHEDMAASLLPSIMELQEEAKKADRTLYFVATVCGTKKDIQNYDYQVKVLEGAGVIVCESNRLAVEASLYLIGHPVTQIEKPIMPARDVEKSSERAVPPAIAKLLGEKPKVINIGLKSFANVLHEFDCETVQFDWAPPAGGDLTLIKTLNNLRRIEDIDLANQKVIDKIVAASPVLYDVVPAKTVIGELNQGKVLLHAGPPMKWEGMPSPMQGSCIGATLFEEWATTEEEARMMLEQGEITFIPCHHVDAVGPMGGITSANMPVFVVENVTDGNRAYCTMNEGIGAVLRFGAYSQEVVDRLCWMRDVLGPVLGKAIRTKEEGLNVGPIMAKALTMGDEFHQRNIAASLIFLKEMSPIITTLDIKEEEKAQVIKFLADTEQFFLNLMMATAKAIMDGARKVTDGTVVTAMCRNGENFGIRISGMGDQWFVAPVNTPEGLFFTGYSGEDASPDMGDSAITETFGVGGMAMIAAPAVTRFVGAGGFEDALQTSNEMMEISIDRNPNYTIPTWNFQGICLGIDARKVVETGITPVINTGIAHKMAGIGQIGAGTVHPPIACFEKAVLAYAKKLGF
ncbi:MAG: acyl-CoA synthetase FdrA [Eubacteriales bacterium]